MAADRDRCSGGHRRRRSRRQLPRLRCERRVLHQRPRLRPRVAADRDHQRASRHGGPGVAHPRPDRRAHAGCSTGRSSVPFELDRPAVRHRRRADRQPAVSTRARRSRGARASTRPSTRASTRKPRLLRDRGGGLVVADAPPLALRRGGARRRSLGRRVATSRGTGSTTGIDEHAAARARADPDDPGGVPRRARPRWRLPMHGGFETFHDHHGRAVRRAAREQHGRSDARAARPAADRGWCCPRSAAMASTGLDLGIGSILPDGWARSSTGCARREIYDAGLRYEDLVRAVDVVDHQARATASSRSASPTTRRWSTPRAAASPSTTCFVREMPRYLRCAYIDNDACSRGRWRAAHRSRGRRAAAARAAARRTAPTSSRI